MKEYRDKSCLPVMAVDDLGPEAYNGQCGQYRTAEECELLYIFIYISVRCKALEIKLIIYKIILDPFVLGLKYPDILSSPVKVHIKMGDICHGLFKLFLDAGILRHDNTYIKFILIKVFGKGSYNISQTPGLDKGYSLRCGK